MKSDRSRRFGGGATALAWIAALACGAMFGIGQLRADDFPSKAVKVIVPVGPGGPTDIVARLVAQVMQPALGTSVVVENRPGAAGATGTKFVAGAEPDGYTLLVGTVATLGVIPALIANPGYDPVKSFTPVAKVAESSLALAVPADLPVTSVAELAAYARANPGKLSYASVGAGNITHLLAELFKAKAGDDLVHVPYKSGAEMITALLGGQVQMAFPDVSILVPMVREGKLKALAVTSPKRHPQLPEVPTMAESGIVDFGATFWSGLVAPAGLPRDVEAKLGSALNDGLRKPEVEASFAKIGAETTPGSPAEFASFIAAEAGKWRAIAKQAGMSPQ